MKSHSLIWTVVFLIGLLTRVQAQADLMLPADLGHITPANAVAVTELARLGRGVINQVALTPDGEALAIASTIGVLLHKADNPEAQSKILEGQGGAVSIAYNPDGSLIASGGQDNSVVLWDAITGEERARLLNHIYPVNAVLFSPDGKLLASGDISGIVRLWDVNTYAERAVFQSHGIQSAMTFSADGSLLASGGSNLARLWDIATGEILAEVDDPGAWDELALEAGDETVILTANQLVLPWDENTVDRLYPGALVWVNFAAENKLISRSESNILQTWNLMTGTLESSLFDPEPTPIPTFFHLSSDGTVDSRDPATGEVFVTYSGHTAQARTVAFSPNQLWVATGADDATARIWNMRTGEPLAILHGHIRSVSNVAFNPESSLLASASYDGTIMLWDMQTYERLATLEGHTLGVTDVAFNREGTVLASASFDGTVILWGVMEGE